MNMPANPASPSAPELNLTRLIDAPAAKLFGARIASALPKWWSAPLPFAVFAAETQVRPSGANDIGMRDRAPAYSLRCLPAG